MVSLLFAFSISFSALYISSAVELTFELPDNEKQCYYEDIKAGEKTSVEFQVSYSVYYTTLPLSSKARGVTTLKKVVWKARNDRCSRGALKPQ